MNAVDDTGSSALHMAARSRRRRHPDPADRGGRDARQARWPGQPGPHHRRSGGRRGGGHRAARRRRAGEPDRPARSGPRSRRRASAIMRMSPACWQNRGAKATASQKRTDETRASPARRIPPAFCQAPRRSSTPPGAAMRISFAQIIAGGADIAARDQEGQTALSRAASRGHRDIVAELLEARGRRECRRRRTAGPH